VYACAQITVTVLGDFNAHLEVGKQNLQGVLPLGGYG